MNNLNKVITKTDGNDWEKSTYKDGKLIKQEYKNGYWEFNKYDNKGRLAMWLNKHSEWRHTTYNKDGSIKKETTSRQLGNI